MPNPDILNNGVIVWQISTSTPGNEGYVRVEAYYDNSGPESPDQPITNRSGRLPNGNTGNRALRVWNTCLEPVAVWVMSDSGRVAVTIPDRGDEVTPCFARTANQLASLDLTTRADLQAITLQVR
jgi:hypothetical protein